MNGQERLRKAKKDKKDEFYTELEEIEKELIHYKQFFADKIIYCNCDNPYTSNFVKYFIQHFNEFKLKKLIATCYANGENGKAYKAVVTEVQGGGTEDIERIFENKKNSLTVLSGSGDFRSEECTEILRSCDIVCTNPPFSLFRDFIQFIFSYDKKFIVIGNMNAACYKDLFPFVLSGKFWAGRKENQSMYFTVPESYGIKGNRINLGGKAWFVSVGENDFRKKLALSESYTPEKYPRYDCDDAIEVGSVRKIPHDYTGVMGVPVNFFMRHNPEQFEIVGIHNNPVLDGRRLFKRILIRRK